jgi:Skp family chaperone for outer membrane proteins
MYIFEHNPLTSRVSRAERPASLRPAPLNPDDFGRTISGYLKHGAKHSSVWVNEGLGQLTTDELSKKLKHFSFLPHFVERNGKDIPLTPSVMDPGIYDGPQNYNIAPRLQDCLKTVMMMEKGRFRHIKVALVDLTKNVMQPEFAASFDHKEPVFAASVPKIAPMLAGYQLRHDLRVALKQKPVKTLDDLFGLVRNDWADTQRDLKAKATPFTREVSCLGTPPCRGKLVLVQGQKIALNQPKAPRLKDIFANAVPIHFKSTGENKAKLKTLIKEFNQASEDLDEARKKLAEEKKKKKRDACRGSKERMYRETTKIRARESQTQCAGISGTNAGDDRRSGACIKLCDLHDHPRCRLPLHGINAPAVRVIRH